MSVALMVVVVLGAVALIAALLGGGDSASAAPRLRVIRDSPAFRFLPSGAEVTNASMATRCIDPSFDRREPKVIRAIRSQVDAESIQRSIIEAFRGDGWTIDQEVNTLTVSDIPPQTVAGATKRFHGWTASVSLWSISSHPDEVSVVGQDASRKYCT